MQSGIQPMSRALPPEHGDGITSRLQDIHRTSPEWTNGYSIERYIWVYLSDTRLRHWNVHWLQVHGDCFTQRRTTRTMPLSVPIASGSVDPAAQ